MTATMTADAVPANGRMLPALSESRFARFATIIILYFLQGVPSGLSTIAIPAWLAANGATPIQVGAFVATALLPWSTKLLNGLVMDRFAYKPMGRRRAWILFAQMAMALTFVTMALAAPSATQIATLAAFCFALNLCATFNDVAVDGMTVDIVPDSERTAINSCMFAAQSTGIAASAFIAGQLLSSGSLATTALILAALVAVASVFVSVFRERPGEKLMPWSSGKASIQCEQRQHSAWRPIVAGVFKAVAARRTILFLAGMGMLQVTFAFLDVVSPTLAVQQLNWNSADYSSLVAGASLVAAGAALFLPTLLVHFMGIAITIRILSLTLVCLGLIGAVIFSFAPGDTAFVLILAGQEVFALLLMIVLLVWAMRICEPAVAASLFALFMAVPNFARSALSGTLGWIVDTNGYPAAFLAVAGLTLAGLALLLLARVGNEKV
ncbi:MAG: MFS transporter [Erythrobacter sp.]